MTIEQLQAEMNALHDEGIAIEAQRAELKKKALDNHRRIDQLNAIKKVVAMPEDERKTLQLALQGIKSMEAVQTPATS
jgi:hypothetical protein